MDTLESRRTGLTLARGVTLTPVGATIAEALTLDEYVAAMRRANTIATAGLWAVGDLLVYGEDHPSWGEMASQAIDLSGRSAWTLKWATTLSRAYPHDTRVPGVSWSHHRDAMHLDAPQDRRDLLEQAAREGWRREEMKGVMGLAVQPRKHHPSTCPACGHTWTR